MPVDISRTGYTGDLGYEIWMPAARALDVWDALVEGGRPFDVKPAGMLALDVARIEAGLLLIEVDFFSSRKAMIASQMYTPYELGMGRLVSLDKGRFIGQRALREEHARGPARQIVGLEIDWNEVEKLYDAVGLAPAVAATASRVATPVYRNGRQVGQGDVHHVVAGAEADDRAGLCRSAAPRRGDRRAVRDDRGGRPPPRPREGGEDAVLQPAAEDGDAPGMSGRRVGLRLFWCFFALYALTSSGNAFRVPDEFEVYFQAQHLAAAGDLSVPQTLAITQEGQPIFFGEFGVDGRPYAPYGPGRRLSDHPVLSRRKPGGAAGRHSARADARRDRLGSLRRRRHDARDGLRRGARRRRLLSRVPGARRAARAGHLPLADPGRRHGVVAVWDDALHGGLACGGVRLGRGPAARSAGAGTARRASVSRPRRSCSRSPSWPSPPRSSLRRRSSSRRSSNRALPARTRWIVAITLAAGAAVGAAGQIGWNLYRFGHPLDFGYNLAAMIPQLPARSFAPEDVPRGLFVELLTPGKSLFVWAPATLLGLLALPICWRRERGLAAGLALATVTVLVFYAAYLFPEGGYAHGPRHARAARAAADAAAGRAGRARGTGASWPRARRSAS